MTYKELLKYFGGSNKLIAKSFGLGRPAPYFWRDRGIPIERQLQIEVLTEGVLKADLGMSEECLKVWEGVVADYKARNAK